MVARSALATVIDDGRVLDLQKKLVPPAAFTAFFEGREYVPEEAPKIEINPQPLRDRDQIPPGERISAFIRRLTRADLVVAVISDKYLCSPYCMYEIHALWQKSQEDADLMAERLVPIVLPDVKLKGLRDRAPYVRFWKKEKEDLEELFRELGSDLAPNSLRRRIGVGGRSV